MRPSRSSSGSCATRTGSCRPRGTVLTAAAAVSAALGGRPALNEGDAGSWLSWNRHQRCSGRRNLVRTESRTPPTAGRPSSARVSVRSARRAPLRRDSVRGHRSSRRPRTLRPRRSPPARAGAAMSSTGRERAGFLCVTTGAVDDPSPLLGLPVGNGAVQLCAASNAVGAAYDWARAIVGVGHDEAERLAATATPGAGGLVLLPWLQGLQHPFIAPEARGAAVGLSLETDRGDLLRGILRARLSTCAGISMWRVGSADRARSRGSERSADTLRAVEPPRCRRCRGPARRGSRKRLGCRQRADRGRSGWPLAERAGRRPGDAGERRSRFTPEPQLVETARAAAAIADQLAERVLPLFGSLTALRDVQQ